MLYAKATLKPHKTAQRYVRRLAVLMKHLNVVLHFCQGVARRLVYYFLFIYERPRGVGVTRARVCGCMCVHVPDTKPRRTSLRRKCEQDPLARRRDCFLRKMAQPNVITRAMRGNLHSRVVQCITSAASQPDRHQAAYRLRSFPAAKQLYSHTRIARKMTKDFLDLRQC